LGGTRLWGLGRLSLRQLELLAIVAPLAFLAAVYFLVLGPVHPFFHSWFGFVFLAAVLAAAVWAFSGSVFGAVRRLQREVEELGDQARRHNQQLVSLHSANLALMRERTIDEALARIVELSSSLLDACQAVLFVSDEGRSRPPLVHPPVDGEMPPSCELGELAMLASEGGGFHVEPGPQLIVVPVASRGTPIGTLCLGRAADGTPFSTVDEEIARMFGTHAALVVQNARLYNEVRTLAVESERQALAREMHDSLAQLLAFVNTKAQAVEQYLRNEDIGAARQQMAELSAAAREVYADIREGIAALRVDVAGKTPHELISEYATQFGESTGLHVQLDWRAGDEELELPPAAEVQLLRIVQEALANVRRHSGAAGVDIRTTTEDGRLSLVVADDGHGFEAEDHARDGRPHFGLQTMAERAKAIGGELSVESAPGEGTRVRVVLPVAVRAAAGSGA
jgi:nitrate/nitrite-specific signal transduction histidine kinase